MCIKKIYFCCCCSTVNPQYLVWCCENIFLNYLPLLLIRIWWCLALVGIGHLAGCITYFKYKLFLQLNKMWETRITRFIWHSGFQPGLSEPIGVCEKSEGVHLPFFNLIFAVRFLLKMQSGVGEFYFFCFSVRELKKVGNCWSNRFKKYWNICIKQLFWNHRCLGRGAKVS